MNARQQATLFDAGIAHHRAGRHVEAERAYRAALVATPRDTRIWVNLAGLLSAEGRLDEAVEALRKALQVDPNSLELVVALGRVFEQSDDRKGVLEMLARAIDLAPDNADLKVKHGTALAAAGRFDEARAALEGAVALDPSNLHARVNLGLLQLDQRRLDEAYASFLAAAAAHPDVALAHEALGTAVAMQGSVRAAEMCFVRARELGGGEGDTVRAALLLPTVAASHEALLESRHRYATKLQELRESGTRLADPVAEVGTTSFLLAYQGMDDRGLQEALASFYLEACPELAWTAPHCRQPRRAGQRIRVGILSRYLGNHTIGKVNRGIIEELDRQRFDVTAILVGAPDAMTSHVIAKADHSMMLAGSLAAMREHIAAAELDVLFYTDIGMEPVSYFLAFARLARLQLVTWGHPDTTGIASLDGFVSSSEVEPDGAQDLYTEPLIRLSRIPTCYRRPPVDVGLPGRWRLPFDHDWKIYACAQSLFKVHPDFDEVVGEILRRDPRGRVVFVDGHTQHWSETLNARLERTIPDVADRVVFLPRLTEFDYYNLLAGADALLDTIHFGGGSTTYESFAIGSPVVTSPGRFARGRVTAASYARMGMADLVAGSVEEYVETAVRLANDGPWRMGLREQILAANDAIFDDLTVVRELERVFEDGLAEARI